MDIGLFLGADQASADIAVQNGAIALDGTLYTAVLLSLLCDRVADSDDVIPDGSTNRRGYWYDAYAPRLPDGTKDYWGSKLWLRLRSLATTQTALLVQGDCEQALDWMIVAGVAIDVEVTTEWVSDTALSVDIVISRQSAGGAPYDTAFNVIWDRTLGLLQSINGPAFALALPVPPVLSVGRGVSRNTMIPPAGLVFTNAISLGVVDLGDGFTWTQNIATLQLVSIGWANMPAESQGLPMLMSIAGVPGAGVRYLFSLAEAYTIPANLAGTTTISDTAPAENAVFALSIIRAGVETALATVTLQPGAAAILSMQAAFVTEPWDALVLTTPETVDETLSGIAISLLLQRI
jgi:phage gp46-like protein